MKDEKSVGLALAVVLAGFSVLCGILVYAAPGLALQLAGYLTHSTIPFSIKPFDLGGVVIGLVLWAVIGFVAGVVFVKVLWYSKEK